MTRLRETLILSAGLSLASLATAPVLADDAALEAARQDMAKIMGPAAFEFQALPDSVFASTWAQFKAIHVEGAMSLPPKQVSLLGIAVAAQIPCQYCLYAETANARLFGATDQEIKDAIMVAAVTREWSTLMHGLSPDLEAFKAQVDASVAARKEMMAAETE